jgi:hypothetical protein
MNVVFAVLVLAAMVAVVPSASAATALVVASGSSAMWQTIGLAAFNNGNCGTASVALKPPCFHWTSKVKLNLQDTRPTLVDAARGGPGAATEDAGNTWVVWDSAATPHYWVYIQEDSTLGNRCFWANPACQIIAPASDAYAAGELIASSLWGPDSALPTSLQTVFNAGVTVNAAASDIRAEDAAFAECRANSALGNGTINGGNDDGVDGLGYNVNNPSGTCPQYSVKVAKKTVYSTLSQLEGTSVVTGYPGSTSSFHVLAFNISGKDPFTGKAIPTTNTTISVGVDPIVFVTDRQTVLAPLVNATAAQLQTLFSGSDCDAFDVFGLGTGTGTGIYAYVREPLSGTYNTTESTVMRRPVQTAVGPGVIGTSMEWESSPLAPQSSGFVNPLQNTPCMNNSAGHPVGFRSRAIGTGQEVQSVQNSQLNNELDGIGYTFFSFGNVNPLAASGNYGYLTLEGSDPIFSAQCGPAPAVCSAPGQPNNAELPGATTVCGGTGFPCSESQIWGPGKLSFPQVRSGEYSAWSMLRWIATTKSKTDVQDLINGSHTYVVNATPDYIPAVAQPTGCSISGGTCVDPGVQIFRTHYQQLDGDGNALGVAGAYGTFNANNNPTGGDTGGDMGGCIVPTPPVDDIGFIQIGLDGNAADGGPGATGNACSTVAVRN